MANMLANSCPFEHPTYIAYHMVKMNPIKLSTLLRKILDCLTASLLAEKEANMLFRDEGNHSGLVTMSNSSQIKCLIHLRGKNTAQSRFKHQHLQNFKISQF